MQPRRNNEGKLAKCPYNPNHTMPENRLMWHISNGCQDKQFYGHLYATCPHNPLHIFRKNMMDAHIAKCPGKKDSIAEDLGISEEELAAAISNQFKPDKNKIQKAQEQEKERIRQNNNKILGYEEQDLDQSTSTKKKRIRKKKEKVVEPPKEKPAEEKSWYETSYGAHATKLLNVEEKKDDDEDDFENMFKSEETALKQGGPNNNQQLQDNSMYNSQSASLDVSSISIAR